MGQMGHLRQFLLGQLWLFMEWVLHLQDGSFVIIQPQLKLLVRQIYEDDLLWVLTLIQHHQLIIEVLAGETIYYLEKQIFHNIIILEIQVTVAYQLINIVKAI